MDVSTGLDILRLSLKKHFYIGVTPPNIKLGPTLDFLHGKKKKKSGNKIMHSKMVLFTNGEFSKNESKELPNNGVLHNSYHLLLTKTFNAGRVNSSICSNRDLK